MPGENIDVKSVDSSLVLSGVVSSAGRAEKARALTAAIAREAKDAKIINELSVATPNQVNLRVRIAEVDRTVMKALGINLSRPNGQITFSTFNPPVGILAAGGTVNARFGPSALPINATLDALAQEGLVRNLAEPNLTAVSGQTASFLAGGEIPYVTTQLAGNGNAFIQTTLFKPFGVQLQFTPTIIDANHVSLRVHPEVSAPVAGATNPPPLTVRRAETTVELGSGESFALAGLYQDNTQETISKFPWLADLPILGQLFRSQQFQRSETELVIIVTPYLVKPSATAALAPTDGFVAPHDAEQIINASTYRPTLPAAGKGPATRDGQRLIGPVGFRID
jgi:pilus assembly protein CpaC